MSNGETLIWEHAGKTDHHQYLIRSGETIISQIHFVHTQQHDALFELGKERILVEKHLTATYHLILRKDGVAGDLATFEADVQATGKLTLADGSTFTWQHQNIFTPEWLFVDAAESPIVNVKAQFDFKRPHGLATLHHPLSEETILLTTLGCYIIILTNLYPSYLFNR